MISNDQRALGEKLLSEFQNALSAYNSAIGPAQNEALAQINTVIHRDNAQARHNLLHSLADAQLASAERIASSALAPVHSDPAKCLDQARQSDGYKAAENRREAIGLTGLRLAESAIVILKTALGIS
jgi:hypothetical protein